MYRSTRGSSSRDTSCCCLSWRWGRTSLSQIAGARGCSSLERGSWVSTGSSWRFWGTMLGIAATLLIAVRVLMPPCVCTCKFSCRQAGAGGGSATGRIPRCWTVCLYGVVVVFFSSRGREVTCVYLPQLMGSFACSLLLLLPGSDDFTAYCLILPMLGIGPQWWIDSHNIHHVVCNDVHCGESRGATVRGLISDERKKRRRDPGREGFRSTKGSAGDSAPRPFCHVFFLLVFPDQTNTVSCMPEKGDSADYESSAGMISAVCRVHGEEQRRDSTAYDMTIVYSSLSAENVEPIPLASTWRSFATHPADVH